MLRLFLNTGSVQPDPDCDCQIERIDGAALRDADAFADACGTAASKPPPSLPKISANGLRKVA